MGWKQLVSSELLLLLFTAVTKMPQVSAAGDTIRPECKNKCSDISIHYPFGIGSDCSRQGFALSCNETVSPPLLLVHTNLGSKEVTDVSLSGQLRIKADIGIDCYNKSGVNFTTVFQSINLEDTPFTFSDTMNKFTVVGCDTISLIGGTSGVEFVGGCVSYCGERLDGVPNGTCSGMGCCQVSFPRGLKSFTSMLGSSNKYNRSWLFNRCGYSFLVEETQYNFSTTDLNSTDFQKQARPIVLDWSIGNQTCQQVLRSGKVTAADYACRSNGSECVDSNNGVGYICKCSDGYAGDPYLDHGCQDIDECLDENKSKYPCKGHCENKLGGYDCYCPQGTSSPDPKKERCVPDAERSPKMLLATKLGIVISGAISIEGFGATFLLFLTAASWAYWGFQKRRLLQLKHKFFQQNGGLFLQEQLPRQDDAPSGAFKIFTEDDLAKATGNFDDTKILGRGGHGTVYKGILDDGREVAVKRSRSVDERQSKEFAKEMIILSQINYGNIVKLLGCCLEVEVPMLVYEFVPNGTLFESIQDKRSWYHSTSMETRLRIAVEAAEALVYLHSHASPPILHGDIKSSNILLDGNYVAKVSDFGASILSPLDREQFATVLQGTCGYLDPEYLITCQLTEKSDVYSFGVVLVELITGKKALHFDDGPNSAEDKSLAMCFISAFKENKLMQILEARLVNVSGEGTEVLKEVAKLAHQCLQLKGEDRPTMKEVVWTLQNLKGGFEAHPWAPPLTIQRRHRAFCPRSRLYTLPRTSTASVSISALRVMISYGKWTLGAD